MIRKATIRDMRAIHRLLKEYGKLEELLARPLSELYDHVRDFSVYLDPDNDTIIGCCALQFCWEDLAEIRSLAVHPDHLGRGIGRQLTQAVLEEAKQFDVKQIFTLTYKPKFFQPFGFVKIDRSERPLKIWSDCIICVKFPDCDETAMMMQF
jgi:amino-acid N-acetyltransferase